MAFTQLKFIDLSDKFSKHLSAFKSYLKKQAVKFENEIRQEAADCVQIEGKYLRPLLVFASAPTLKHNSKNLINRASVAELIHLASLIHDDVIDNAYLRRNKETAFKKLGARTAILLGDAIFARAMEMAFEEEDKLLHLRSVQAVKTLCEGEIRQSLAVKNKTDYKKYLSIIEQKTASLFEFACFLGARLEGCDAWTKAAQKAGKHLGIAYQMYDDICDWTLSEKESGKTAGTDFIFEKYTLPLIVLLQKLSGKDAKNLEKSLHNFPMDKLSLMMKEYNVLEDCSKIYQKELQAAKASIAKFSDKNKALLSFCDEMSTALTCADSR